MDNEQEQDRSLTEVVLPVLGFAQLRRESLEALLAWLEKTHALHVCHTVTLLVVYLVRKVYLMRKKSGLRS